MRLPRRKLKCTGKQQRDGGRDGYRASERRLPHFHRRQRDAERKRSDAEQNPHEEVSGADAYSQPAETRARDTPDDFAIAPQHRDQ
jgi:hypothetical protein